jgi:solute carrier family 27 fatty acid transporter 1/4
MKTCAVYGVSIPGTEGKCGMAAIADPQGNLNLHKLTESVQNALPAYARPLFLRVLRTELNMTGRYELMNCKLNLSPILILYFVFICFFCIIILS